SDAEAIRDVLFNSEPRPDINTRTVIQMSTIAPEESQRLKSDIEKAAGRYLEAPVLGSTPQAKEGKLMVMVGADEKTQFEQWSEVLNCFSSEPLFIGSVGQAAALKLALNQLIASLSAAFSYSLGIIRRRDIDVVLFMKILKDSPLFAPQFEKKLPRLLKREFSDPNFPTKHLRKDVELALKEGETLGLNTASISGILEILQQALEEGWSETDYSSIYNVIQPER
ncbi:NAD(P)-dependent oxidoreductase, partial [candidate division KSB1 bacterium]|nr:NAD(P)-dependent oxidoreductase [candidate division KSB1 bacterium]NIR70852.1 NAD(P)-dependent oxidoreductase [candidate division KSB1 bacterium]NIS24638.1 NAD(P)-dependent oxidoreductase [candidate division KSB1 bacterium]NIT71540.1 NAD(P)-dependent oxidoreductase [candidate division KSB1 bacterium]NIU25238.1 NAD(P)-dependent oxidoreductase [candidate division KSB1 bacterium]